MKKMLFCHGFPGNLVGTAMISHSSSPEDNLNHSISLSVDRDFVRQDPDALLSLGTLSLLPAGTNLRCVTCPTSDVDLIHTDFRHRAVYTQFRGLGSEDVIIPQSHTLSWREMLSEPCSNGFNFSVLRNLWRMNGECKLLPLVIKAVGVTINLNVPFHQSHKLI